MERHLSTGHGGLTVFFGCDEFNYRTFGYFVWNNGGSLVITSSKKVFEISHNISALVFGRLVATLAMGLKDGADLFEKTYLASVLLSFVLSYNVEEMTSQNDR